MSEHCVSVHLEKSRLVQGSLSIKTCILMAVILLMTTSVQAQVPTITNGGFETGDFGEWFHRTAYCWVRGATGGTFPDNPQGTNWVELGNMSWVYQEIGQWTDGLTLDVSLSVGSVSGKDFPGVHISLWAGGDPSLAANDNPAVPATTLESTGAVQIAISDLIQPAALTGGTAEASEQSVSLSTGSGYTEGAPLWLLVQAAGRQRLVMGNVKVMVASSGPTAMSPLPQVNAEDIQLTDTLSWAVMNAENPTFAINIGTTESCDDVLSDESTNGAMNYALPAGLLEYGIEYCWRVDVTENGTTYPGPVWSFTAEPYSIMIPIDVNNVTASSFKDVSPPSMIVNGAGLDANTHSNNPEDMWLSGEPDMAPWLMFELNDIQKLDQVLIWNANSTSEGSVGWGIKDVNIVTSMDGIDWTALSDVTQISQAPGLPTYGEPQVIDLGLVLAKYVRINILSNWGGLLKQYSVAEVQFHGLPVYARTPDPVSGSVILPDAAVTWRAGREASEHLINVSGDPNALADGTASSVSSMTSSADLSSLDLELGQDYYWRVDEVNEAEAQSAWQGPVWTFSTVPSLTVDDFESYTNDASTYSRVFQTWIDGAGYTNPVEVPGNGTGSYMGHNPQIGDIMEKAIVHGGGQSAPISFGNNGQTLSEVDRTFDEPQDWTRSGVQSLAIYVYGLPGNTGQLYLKINGLRIDYTGLSDALQRQQWVLWAVDLSTLAVDLTNITSLTIGIEGASAPGMIYVDDIALYPQSVALIEPAAPSDNDPNLVTHYEFEGNVDDRLGAHHATAAGEPKYTDGKIGQAISLDGFFDYVAHTFEADVNWPGASVTLWAKTEFLSQEIWSGLFNNNAVDNDFQIDVDGGDPGFYRYNGTGGGHLLGPVTNEWVHLAMSCDGTQTSLYYNGVYVTSLNVANTQFGQIAVGVNRGMATTFAGQIDDVRVYNRPLSHAEVAGLADITEPIAAPF